MPLVAVKRNLLIGPIERLVNPDSRVAIPVELFNQLLVGSFLLADDGPKDDGRPRAVARDEVSDLFRALWLDADAVVRAGRYANARKEEPEVIVDLSH